MKTEYISHESENKLNDLFPQYESMVIYRGKNIGESSKGKWARIFNYKITGKDGGSNWGIPEYDRGAASLFIQLLIFDGATEDPQAVFRLTLQIVKTPLNGVIIAQNKMVVLSDYASYNGNIPKIELVEDVVSSEESHFSLWCEYAYSYQNYCVVPEAFHIGLTNANRAHPEYDTRYNDKLKLDIIFKDFLTNDPITKDEYDVFKTSKNVVKYRTNKALIDVSGVFDGDTLTLPNISEDYELVHHTNTTVDEQWLSKIVSDKETTKYNGYKVFIIFWGDNINLVSLVGSQGNDSATRKNKVLFKGGKDRVANSGEVIEIMRYDNFWVEL